MSRLVETKVYLPADQVRAIELLAARTRARKSQIVRAALAAFLSPDGPDQLEAALGRRLDRITRHLERLERDLAVANEAQALFIRAWLTATPPLPEPERRAAETKGRERYSGFIDALGRRLAAGRSVTSDVLQDHPASHADSSRRGILDE